MEVSLWVMMALAHENVSCDMQAILYLILPLLSECSICLHYFLCILNGQNKLIDQKTRDICKWNCRAPGTGRTPSTGHRVHQAEIGMAGTGHLIGEGYGGEYWTDTCGNVSLNLADKPRESKVQCFVHHLIRINKPNERHKNIKMKQVVCCSVYLDLPRLQYKLINLTWHNMYQSLYLGQWHKSVF